MNKELEGYRIIMGIGGSISAYRTPDIIRELKKKGADVFPVLSGAASRIIGEESLEWASGNIPITELTGQMEHITLMEYDPEKTVLLICPATYNQIGKMANGIADAPVETIFANALGSGVRIVVVPAMHLEMFSNKILERNISVLREMGVMVMEPRLEDGKAKIMWPEEIVDAVLSEKPNKSRILIVSGKSTIDIDPVRSIVNRSSGKTGEELARAAYRSGSRDITLVGNSEGRIPAYCKHHSAISADEFYSITENLVKENRFDAIMFPAALSDFTTMKQKEKISGSGEMTLKLEPRDKLISRIKKIPNASESRIVSFKLSGEGVDQKASDSFIQVVNFVEDKPFENSTNQYTIYRGKREIFHGKMSKPELAGFIMREINAGA